MPRVAKSNASARGSRAKSAGPTVTVDRDFDSIRIRFNGVLHCYVPTPDGCAPGIQSWRHHDRKFVVEYALPGRLMTCEYDDAAKWKTILAELDKIL